MLALSGNKVACLHNTNCNSCFQLPYNYCTYLCREFSPPWFSCSAIDSNNKLGYRISARTASHFKPMYTLQFANVAEQIQEQRSAESSQIYCNCTIYCSFHAAKLSLLISQPTDLDNIISSTL